MTRSSQIRVQGNQDIQNFMVLLTRSSKILRVQGVGDGSMANVPAVHNRRGDFEFFPMGQDLGHMW